MPICCVFSMPSIIYGMPSSVGRMRRVDYRPVMTAVFGAAALLALGAPRPARAQHVTVYPLPNQNAGPDRITAGPDGALWFTEFYGNKIGRLTTDGHLTEFTAAGLD